MRNNLGFIAVSLLTLLVGCKEGDLSASDPLQGCVPISGGLTRTTSAVFPGCTNCEVRNPAQAIDGNGRSYATLYIPANSGSAVALRVQAQSGVVYPAGTAVGMLQSLTYSSSYGIGYSLASYASGVQQETWEINFNAGNTHQPASAPSRYTRTATMPFDAVEVRIGRGGGAGTVEARIHEFCAE